MRCCAPQTDIRNGNTYINSWFLSFQLEPQAYCERICQIKSHKSHLWNVFKINVFAFLIRIPAFFFSDKIPMVENKFGRYPKCEHDKIEKELNKEWEKKGKKLDEDSKKTWEKKFN